MTVEEIPGEGTAANRYRSIWVGVALSAVMLPVLLWVDVGLWEYAKVNDGRQIYVDGPISEEFALVVATLATIVAMVWASLRAALIPAVVVFALCATLNQYPGWSDEVQRLPWPPYLVASAGLVALTGLLSTLTGYRVVLHADRSPDGTPGAGRRVLTGLAAGGVGMTAAAATVTHTWDSRYPLSWPAAVVLLLTVIAFWWLLRDERAHGLPEGLPRYLTPVLLPVASVVIAPSAIGRLWSTEEPDEFLGRPLPHGSWLDPQPGGIGVLVGAALTFAAGIGLLVVRLRGARRDGSRHPTLADGPEDRANDQPATRSRRPWPSVPVRTAVLLRTPRPYNPHSPVNGRTNSPAAELRRRWWVAVLVVAVLAAGGYVWSQPVGVAEADGAARRTPRWHATLPHSFSDVVGAVAAGDALVVQAYSRRLEHSGVVVYDKRSGTRRWSYAADLGEDVLVRATSDAVILVGGWGDRNVRVFDLDTGKPRFAVKVVDAEHEPVIGEDTLVVDHACGESCTQVTSYDLGTGEQRWRLSGPTLSDRYAPPLDEGRDELWHAARAESESRPRYLPRRVRPAGVVWVGGYSGPDTPADTDTGKRLGTAGGSRCGADCEPLTDELSVTYTPVPNRSCRFTAEARELAGGERRWRTRLGERVPRPYGCELDGLPVGDTLLVDTAIQEPGDVLDEEATYHTVEAVDVTTGGRRWIRRELASPFAITERTLVIHHAGRRTYGAVDVRTGRDLWTGHCPGGDPDAVVVSDGLFTCRAKPGGRPEIWVRDLRSGTVKWLIRDSGEIRAAGEDWLLTADGSTIYTYT